MRRGEVWRVTLEATVGDRLVKKSGLTLMEEITEALATLLNLD